jgi:predicted CDP-diglyceride synthetase/phosphatidate cytidylyltransferase
MEGIKVVLVLVWLATLAATIDAFRRPKARWVEADRNRGWWTTGLVMSCIILLPTIVFLPGYLFGCLPAFQSGGTGRSISNANEFRR